MRQRLLVEHTLDEPTLVGRPIWALLCDAFADRGHVISSIMIRITASCMNPPLK